MKMNELYIVIGLVNAIVVVFFYKRFSLKLNFNQKERTANHEDTIFIMDFLKAENERLRKEIEQLTKRIGK